MNAKKVPQLFVASGATKFGDPNNFPWTMGWQPNYQSEGRKYILDHFPNGKIAVFWQNDDAGRDQVKGLRDGLGDRAGMIIADKSYEVSDPTIAGGCSATSSPARSAISRSSVKPRGLSWFQPALSRTPARRNFCGSTASPSILVS